MLYQHSEDISEDHKGLTSKLDEQMITATNRIINALDSSSTLNGTFGLVVSLLLKSFLFTHKSIVIILMKGNEEKYGYGVERESDKTTDMTLGADAMSLVREQVEKVFAVTLLCDDPDRWIEVYMKDDWRRFYELYLVQKDEMKNLPRSQHFFDVIAPDLIEKYKRQAITFITDEEQEAIEFRC